MVPLGQAGVRHGEVVSFISQASNLVPADTNKAVDVFVHDRSSGRTERVSVSSGEIQANGSSETSPAISADARFVAFYSHATNLAEQRDTNGVPDIFLRDRARGTTERVSVTWQGRQADGESSGPVISVSGRYVAFYSKATNLVTQPDANGVPDVFVRDRVRGTTTRVSVGWKGEEANGNSFAPDITRGGRFVAFYSVASNLVRSPNTNRQYDVFVRDRLTHTTSRVSVTWRGHEANGSSYSPCLSPGGRFVGFESDATNLNRAGDTNRSFDVLVRDREKRTTSRASISWSEKEASPGSPALLLSDGLAPGRRPVCAWAR